MLIKMLGTHAGSPDGFRIRRYYKGCMYEVPHTLAASFISKGQAMTQVKPIDEVVAELIFACLSA